VLLLGLHHILQDNRLKFNFLSSQCAKSLTTMILAKLLNSMDGFHFIKLFHHWYSWYWQVLVYDLPLVEAVKAGKRVLLIYHHR
jgi:hypothetical protein